MQVDFADYNRVLSKFIAFIRANELIHDYIVDCGDCDQDLPQEFQEVTESYGDSIFSLGTSDEEEIRNVFAILCYIDDKDIEIQYGVAIGYSSSNKYQDMVKSFNERVVMVLIRQIERFLTKIGIDMGLDDKNTYSITVTNGQVNIASDSAVINATSTVNTIDAKRLSELINAVKTESESLSEGDEETLANSLEVVEEELKTDKPRKGFIKTAIAGIKAIKGTAEFATAVAALIQFLQPLI
jgi:hypothetical protein